MERVLHLRRSEGEREKKGEEGSQVGDPPPPPHTHTKEDKAKV